MVVTTGDEGAIFSSMSYSTELGVAFWVVIVLMVGLIGYGLYVVLVRKQRSGLGFVLSPVALLGLLALIAFPITYELAGDKLITRSGVLTFEVPYDKIKKVGPGMWYVAAPAWGMDRIRIDYDDGGDETFIQVSPSDRQSFLAELAKRADLEGEGETYVRRAVPAP